MGVMDDQEERRLAWVKAGKLREIENGRSRVCRHVLQKTACPYRVKFAVCIRLDHEITDHWRVWQRPDGSRFGLAHVYYPEAEALSAARTWASGNGMSVVSDPGDAWYGFDTVPLRYELLAPGGRGRDRAATTGSKRGREGERYRCQDCGRAFGDDEREAAFPNYWDAPYNYREGFPSHCLGCWLGVGPKDCPFLWPTTA